MGFQDAVEEIGAAIESAAVDGRSFLTLEEEDHVLKLSQEALRQYLEEGWLKQ